MKRKYACLLLKCLNLKENDYLFISIPKHISGFKNILLEECKKFNLKEVYVDEIDEYKKHDLMKYMDQENINKHPMFDSSIYNKYAKLDAAFLFVRSMIPSLMSDIEPIKIKETIKEKKSTKKEKNVMSKASERMLTNTASSFGRKLGNSLFKKLFK